MNKKSNTELRSLLSPDNTWSAASADKLMKTIIDARDRQKRLKRMENTLMLCYTFSVIVALTGLWFLSDTSKNLFQKILSDLNTSLVSNTYQMFYFQYAIYFGLLSFCFFAAYFSIMAKGVMVNQRNSDF